MRLDYFSIQGINCQELFLYFSCVFHLNLLYCIQNEVMILKTKYWIFLLAGLLLACLALSLLTFRGEPASRAKITSEGRVVKLVELGIDQSFTVETEDGFNLITVKDGKIAVTEASCPDHHCMARGFCNSGAQIVCLPNRLVIEFLGGSEIDGVVG